MSNMLLEAKEIHTYYGASHILHGIDFTSAKAKASR
jgi:branched-chain amino acid transport system ATP-binding protein